MLQTDCSDSGSSQSEDDWDEDATDDGSKSSSSGSSRCSTSTTHSKDSSSHAESCPDEDDDDEKLTVHVKLVGKETSESLLIDPSSSVGDLKRHIANRYSVPMERQRLIFFGKLLLDNSQALGPKGACMRLGTINYVHLSPLPDGAKPSDRPVPPTKQPQPSSHQPLLPPPPNDYRPQHSATNGESNSRGDTNMARSSSSILGSQNQVPIALPVPNLTLGAQLARARRLGTQARERRLRRRLEASPYHHHHYALDHSITPDASFSSDHLIHHRYQQHQHQHHNRHGRHHSVRDMDNNNNDDNNNNMEEEDVVFHPLVRDAPLMAPAPFLAPSSLSHSILAHHQPVLPPTSLLSRRPEWPNPLALAASDLPPYSYPYRLASTRETHTTTNTTTTTTSTTGSGGTSATTTTSAATAAVDGWNNLRASRDRLDGIRSMERRQLQERREEEALFRRDILQQVRRSALQLLPAVAEWHLQLERLSQLSPSLSNSLSSTLPHGLAEEYSLIQDTLDQMDGGIGHHWTTRLRPLLMTLQDASIMSLSSDAWFTMGPRSLFSPWMMPPSASSSSSSLSTPSLPSSSVPSPLSIPPGARFF